MAYVTDEFDNQTARLILQGGVGVLPTDTIYGLSCRALDKSAVEKLRRLKGRDKGKPFIVLISNAKMLNMLSISESQAKSLRHYWPGQLSAIFDAPGAPDWLHRDTGTLAVRLPDFPQLATLINKTGPIISTSVNLQGEPPVKSIKEARAIFGDKLDFYVGTGNLKGISSTLVKISGDRLKILRQGAVKINEKERV